MPIIGWVSLQTTGIVVYKFSQKRSVEADESVVFLLLKFRQRGNTDMGNTLRVCLDALKAGQERIGKGDM